MDNQISTLTIGITKLVCHDVHATHYHSSVYGIVKLQCLRNFMPLLFFFVLCSLHGQTCHFLLFLFYLQFDLVVAFRVTFKRIP